MRPTTKALSLFAALLLLVSVVSEAQGWQEAVKMVQQKKYNEAIPILEAELQLSPNWGFGNLLLGIAYKGAGEFDKAIKSLGEARRLEPENFAPMYNLGALDYEKGDYGRAVSELVASERYAPENQKSSILALRGKAYFHQEDYAKAEEDLSKASRAKSDFDVLYYLGAAQFKLEAYTQSIDTLKKALSQRPGDTNALKYLVEAYFKRATTLSSTLDLYPT